MDIEGTKTDEVSVLMWGHCKTINIPTRKYCLLISVCRKLKQADVRVNDWMATFRWSDWKSSRGGDIRNES